MLLPGKDVLGVHIECCVRWAPAGPHPTAQQQPTATKQTKTDTRAN